MENQAVDNLGEEDFVDDAEIQRILDEYNRKQMIENLTGPGISLVCHIVLLILGFVFIVTNDAPKDPPLVVETAIVEELEVEEEILEEIEIEEEVTEDDVPTTDPTEAPSDSVGEQTSPVDVSDDAPQTDDDADMEEVLDIVNNNSPLTYVGPMGGRCNAGRRRAVGKYGGSKGGQNSVNRALRWLASVQNANGSWGIGTKWSTESGHPAHTGLACLVFLAHGETPLSEKYGKTVQNAMRWLATYGSQSDLARIVSKKQGAYTHGIATYAISESYAMTKIPFVQGAMENSIDVIIGGQMATGGFGYGYCSGARWDMSVSGWNFQALKAARMAGCTNERLKDAIRKSINFCKKSAYGGKGGFGYAESPGNKANMGGVGVVSLQLLGASDCKQVTDGCERIGDVRLKDYEAVMVDPSKWDGIGGSALYGWYYDTQAIFNSQDKDKVRWKRWRKAFETVLIRAQNQEGFWQTSGEHQIGTHDTPGRVLATCLAALQLEVYYRYLPTFDKTKLDKFAAEDEAEGIDAAGDGDGGGMVIEIGE